MNKKEEKRRQRRIEIAKAKYEEPFWWDSDDDRVLAEMQLQEPILILPFGRFHEAVEKALGRPVWTHEFASVPTLLAELRGEREAKTMDEIIDELDEDKTIVVIKQES